MATSPRYVTFGTPELSGGAVTQHHSTGVVSEGQRDGMRDGQWPDTGSGAASHTTQTRDDHLDLEDRLELSSGSLIAPEAVAGGDVRIQGVAGIKRQWHQTTVWDCGFRADSAPSTVAMREGSATTRDSGGKRSDARQREADGDGDAEETKHNTTVASSHLDGERSSTDPQARR